MSKEEQEPFITEDEDQQRKNRTEFRHRPYLLSINSFSRLLNVILSIACLLLSVRLWRQEDGRSINFTPASSAIAYHEQPGFSMETWFRGRPNKTMEEQWQRVMTSTLIKVSLDELQAAGEDDSVMLKSGGYAAGLAVSHQLHCVKRLKNFAWSQILHDPQVEQNATLLQEAVDHADHCIDVLRQHVMCNIDTTLMRLEYVPHSKLTGRPAAIQRASKMCTNYDKLHDWMKTRPASANDFVQPDWDSL